MNSLSAASPSAPWSSICTPRVAQERPEQHGWVHGLNLKGEETAADRSESETHGRQKQGDTYHRLHSHSQSATGGGVCVGGGGMSARCLQTCERRIWQFLGVSPHLRRQSATLAFQTLSPVSRETLAAPQSSVHQHLHPRTRHPSTRQTSHPPWESCSVMSKSTCGTAIR